MPKPKVEPLSAHEEGILRATIDEAEASLVDIPPKTVRRLLALVDELRRQDHVTSIAFVQNPLDDSTFFLRMTTNGEKSERIVTRDECVNYLRLTLAARAFDLNGRTIHGAELADLIERGHLP